MSCNPSTSSDLKNADAVISNRMCVLNSVQVIADGTNAVTLVLYDNASAASGRVVAKIVVDAGLTYESFTTYSGIFCNNGLYADVTGTGAEYIVHFGPA